MTAINVQEWKDILATVVKSQTTEKGQQLLPSQYVVVAGKQYQHVGRDKIGKSKKLSVKEIINVSKSTLEEAKKEEAVDWQALGKQIEEITGYVQKLIEAREGKRNQWHKRLLRGIALILSAVTSVILIGIPFFILLRRANQQFALEMQSLRRELSSVRQQTQEIQAKIKQQVKHLPAVIESLPQYINDDSRQKQLQYQLRKDLKETDFGEMAPQFRKDMNRGVSFQRKDVTLEIEDRSAQPSLELVGEQRIEKGQTLLQDLLKRDQDKKWEQTLQLVASQTSLNTLFDQVILLFNLDVGMNLDLQWENQNKSYALKAAFSEQMPSIELEVIREAQGDIEKVKVKIKGAVDIGSFNTRDGKITAVVADQAIKGELEYEVTLAEDHSPVVSRLKSRLEVNLSTPQ